MSMAGGGAKGKAPASAAGSERARTVSFAAEDQVRHVPDSDSEEEGHALAEEDVEDDVVGGGAARVGERVSSKDWAAEQGTVREGGVESAKARRAQGKKSEGGGGAGWERYEEEGGGADDDGVRFEPFNMKRERKRGDIDSEGNFVRIDRYHKRHRAKAEGVADGSGRVRDDDDDDAPPAAAADDDDDDDDGDGGGGGGGGAGADDEEEPEEDGDVAWFASAEVARPDVAERHRKQWSTLADGAAAAPANQRDTARWMCELATHLALPEESVAAALRRLGGKAGNKAAKGLPPALRAAAPSAHATSALDEVTRLAGLLMDAGETDVYEHTKRQLERTGAMVLGSSAPGASAGASAAGASAPVDDMFADDDDDDNDEAVAEATAPAARPPPATTAPAPAPPYAPPAAAAAPADVDYASWPVSELRRYLREHQREDAARGCTDKGELAAAVAAVAAERRAAVAAKAAGARARVAQRMW